MVIWGPAPILPDEGTTDTPGARALSSLPTSLATESSDTSDALTRDTALPSARRWVSPAVPVTTSSWSLTGISDRTTLTSPDPTRTVWVSGVYPIALTRMVMAVPARFVRRKRP